MDRNLFETLYRTDGSDGSDISEEELSDGDDEWHPPQREQFESDTSDNESVPGTNVLSAEISRSDNLNDSDSDSDMFAVERPVEENTGKDKKTTWSSVPFTEYRPAQNRLKIPMNRIPNTQCVNVPSDSFLLFIDERMLSDIVKFTNIEGMKQKGEKWKQTDKVEIKALVGCLLHTGSLHQNDISIELLFNIVEGNPLVRAAFSKTRFSNLLNLLRFDDKETRPAGKDKDRFAPIRELWDYFQMNLKKYYHPSGCVTVDEQLVPFRGRCNFIQYMPSKPDKYGIKIFWVCDAMSSYPVKGKPYLGKQTTPTRDATGDSVGATILKELCLDLKDTGRNVTCDNFFTDLKLAEDLLKMKLSIVGTVRRSKTFLPPSFQQKKALPITESKFVFRENMTLVSFQDKAKKNVILLSSMHNSPDIDEDTKKPEIVLEYNRTKGGVDSMDQMAHSFSVKRKTKRWPLVIAYNMIDLAGIAGRVIWSMKYPASKFTHEDNRQLFLIQIARELTLPQIQRRAPTPTLQAPIRHNLDDVLKNLQQSSLPQSAPTESSALPAVRKSTPSKTTPSKSKRVHAPQTSPCPIKQKRCSKCPSKKDRKTKMTCMKCNQHICKEHSAILCTNCAN